ncbi:MAG: NTP transferase domain-containing protein [Nitrospirales bacterium]|nr:NTP transferase domain-containing protein [Nitrospirales bacterium]
MDLSEKMTLQTHNTTGVLLAGGKSVRMGKDKKHITIEGRSLFERALSVLENYFPEVIVVYGDSSQKPLTTQARSVHDLIPHCAAAGGVFTGLTYASFPQIFVVACDMPFLNPQLIDLMVSCDESMDIVIAKLKNRLEPLHARYSKRCLPFLETMIKERMFRMQELLNVKLLKRKIFTEEEIGLIDNKALSFWNLNTPEDVYLAGELLKE